MTTKREFESQCDYDWGEAAAAITHLETQLAEARAEVKVAEMRGAEKLIDIIQSQSMWLDDDKKEDLLDDLYKKEKGL